MSPRPIVVQIDPGGDPLLANGPPLKITRLAASSRRPIACIGMLAILRLLRGCGLFILRGFSQTGGCRRPRAGSPASSSAK